MKKAKGSSGQISFRFEDEYGDLRNGTVVGPVLELKVVQRELVVRRLEILGENVAVRHGERSSGRGTTEFKSYRRSADS